MPIIAESDCDFRSERNRLESFKNWPLSWLLPADLAADGFFYLGKKDQCMCAFCRGIVVQWKKEDDIREEHKKHYPQCPFINNENVSNIPLHLDTYHQNSTNDNCLDVKLNELHININANKMDRNDSPNSPATTHLPPTVIEVVTNNDLREERYRLETFKKWPLDWLLPSDLSADGFYYLGKKDYCQCIFCNQIVGQWEKTDTPRGEHKKYNAECPFITGQRVGNVPINKSSNIPLHHGTSRQDSTNDNYLAEENKDPHKKSNANKIDRNNSQDTQDSTSPLPPTVIDIETNNDLREERYRLETFKKWPLAWLLPSDLSADGFYYLGKKDYCQCIFCNQIVGQWEKTDTPRGEHKKYNAECPFITGQRVGNVPVSKNSNIYLYHGTANQDSTNDKCSAEKTEEPRKKNDANKNDSNDSQNNPDSISHLPPTVIDIETNNDLREERCRLETFKKWPLAWLLPSDLSADGFYYLGKKDYCQCIFCNQIVGQWEKTDTPRGEHKKYNAECPFITGQRVGNIPMKKHISSTP